MSLAPKQQIPTPPPTWLTPATPTVTSYEAIITADVAREVLKRNNNNRPVSEYWVRYLADEILSGHYLFTGETLQIDWNGILINAQHRLKAVVLSDSEKPGSCIRMLVVQGLDPKTREVIDQNKVRSLHDNLTMLGGVKRASMVSGLIKMIERAIRYDSSKVSYADAIATIDKRAKAIKWMIGVAPGSRSAACQQFGISPIVAAFVYAYPAYPKVVEECYQKLISGTFRNESDPLKLLWEYRYRNKISTDMSRVELFQKTLCAIHAWREGESFTRNLLISQQRIDFFKKANGDK